MSESVWNVSNTIIYSTAINSPGDLNALLQVAATSNSHISYPFWFGVRDPEIDTKCRSQKLEPSICVLKKTGCTLDWEFWQSRDFVDATTPRLAQGPPNVLSGVCRSKEIGAL